LLGSCNSPITTKLRGSMASWSMHSACDRGSYATQKPVIGWVTNLLSGASAGPCSSRHVKPLVLAAIAIIRTHQSALGLCGGLWPVLLIPFSWVIQKKGLCPSSGDINRLMLMMIYIWRFRTTCFKTINSILYLISILNEFPLVFASYTAVLKTIIKPDIK
jgi:hypothetical protein